MGGFWEVCFLRKAQEPHHPKPGFPGFRASALHSSATLPNGSAALPILCRRHRSCAPSRTIKSTSFCASARKLAGVALRHPRDPMPQGKAYATLKLTILWKSFKKIVKKLHFLRCKILKYLHFLPFKILKKLHFLPIILAKECKKCLFLKERLFMPLRTGRKILLLIMQPCWKVQGG